MSYRVHNSTHGRMWKYHLKEKDICLNFWQTLNSLWTAPWSLLRALLSCQQSADSDKIHPQLNDACMRDVRLEGVPPVLITHYTWRDSYPEGMGVIRIIMNSAYIRHSQFWDCSAARLTTRLSVTCSLKGCGVSTTYIPHPESFIFLLTYLGT